MTRSIDDEVRENQKLHRKGSPALELLEQILESRHQGWCRYGQLDLPSDGIPDQIPDSEFRRCIHELGRHELARALVRACVHGDLKIAKTIWSARGPFAVEYQPNSIWTIIGGTKVSLETSANHLFTNSSSGNDLRELLEWMPSVGLGFMVGIGSEHALLFDSNGLKRPINQLTRPPAFAGDLPVLSGGFLHHPELAIALRAKSLKTHYPKPYKKVLCWVEEEMLAVAGDNAEQFSINHGLTLGQGEDEHQVRITHDLKACTEDALRDVQSYFIEDNHTKRSHGEWEALRLAMRREPVGQADADRQNMILGHLGSEEHQYGLSHRPGYVLCSADLEYLCSFEMGAVRTENLARSRAFVSSYFPLDMISLDAKNGDRAGDIYPRDDIGVDINLEHGSHEGLDKLYQSMGNKSPIKDLVRPMIPKDLVSFLLKLNCSRTVDAKSMLCLQQAFGMDNTGLAMSPNHHDLQMLLDEGFAFSKETATNLTLKKIGGRMVSCQRENSQETKVFLSVSSLIREVGLTNKTLENEPELDAAYRNAIRLGLWPSSKPSVRPRTIAAALKMVAALKFVSTENHDQALLAYLTVAGPEACAKAAKSADQWLALKTHFGSDTMDQYLGLADRAVRGGVLEDELGM
ncbi:hypothetical protein [Pseudomonas putida]|uniref:Uncharacterized protein n=1 Tax=Pseudomonas putida TaxID=303 RepID=A0A8I1EIR0_PSEPU|nr:hypothetical protein [Pseudomonas putida]MBI6885868.1 hypothetical protein [Pseudomonas putida]